MKKFAFLLAVLLLVSVVEPSVFANSYTVPNLMITEVTPDSKTVTYAAGTPDAYEFVEIYNNTAAAINLQNYRIIYNNGSADSTWTIADNESIPAKGTYVVWLIPSGVTATEDNFRTNYGVTSTTLPNTRICKIVAGGMANTSTTMRTVSLRAPGTGTTDICTTTYVPDEDVVEQRGIPYLYPTDGTVAMRKLTTDTSAASPATVFEGQVPPASWDSTAPAQPGTITATPGANQVTLSWPANSETDLAFYRVYIDGVHWHTYRKITTSCVVTGLNTEQDYTFAVAAVDTSNNVSTQRTVISAPQSIALTAANYVTTPSGLFSEFFSNSTTLGYVPGLAQDMIPQGVAFIPASSWPAYTSGVYVITHYRDDGNSSMLSFVNAANNAFIKSVVLYNTDRTVYNGHCGGVAVSAQNLWVASGDYLRRLPMADVIAAGDRTKVFFADRFMTTSNASFAFFANGILWSGEFYYDPGYLTDASHQSTARDGTTQFAWISGYNLNSSTDLLPAGKYVNDTTAVTPDYILSTPNKVQGACRLLDGRFVLTRSYGRNSYSTFYFYNNVLSESAHSTRTVNGTSVPLWFLDGNSMRTYTMPSLMITEATPDTYTSGDVTGQPDAYEYIELYNTTSSAINLQNYRIIYNNGSEVTWTITESKSIPAKGIFVVRILPSGVTASNTKFRTNYGVTSTVLPDAQITTITADGMANASSRTIALRAPGTGSTNISYVSYDAADVTENNGIRYMCPKDGTVNMRKALFGAVAAGTPGTVEDMQINPAILTASPLLEGIVQKDSGYLVANFESGATAYNDGVCPVDNLYRLNISAYN